MLQRADPIVVCLFHAHDFADSGDRRGELTYQGFTDLLDWVSSQPDVRFVAPSGPFRHIDLSPNRLRVNRSLDQPLFGGWAIIPPFIAARSERNVYLPTDAARKIHRTAKNYTILFYAVCLFLAWLSSLGFGSLLRRRSRRLVSTAMYLSALLIALSLVYAFRDLRLGWRGLTASLVLLGSFTRLASAVALGRTKCNIRMQQSANC
jgi:hypothetical protein